MKTKVLDIHENGMHLVCIRDDGVKYNPYRLYKVWYDIGECGAVKHRKQIAKYADFLSIMHHIHEEFTKGRPIWGK